MKTQGEIFKRQTTGEIQARAQSDLGKKGSDKEDSQGESQKQGKAENKAMVGKRNVGGSLVETAGLKEKKHWGHEKRGRAGSKQGAGWRKIWKGSSV